MAQTLVNIRMDEELKKNMEQTCQELGMTMTTAITIFAKKMTSKKRIPFEISIDPFYSESNMAHLHRGVEALNAGKGVEHDKFCRIDDVNRLVYRICDDVMEIVSCKGHYERIIPKH